MLELQKATKNRRLLLDNPMRTIFATAKMLVIDRTRAFCYDTWA